MATESRSRRFEIIGYPESLSKNWIARMNDRFISFAHSPLHDKDVDEETGELKKPHFHIYMEFEGKKSSNQILDIADMISASHHFVIVESKRKCIRYFIHLDNPDKYQYALEDCGNYGVEDFAECFENELNNISIFSQIFQYIEENNVSSLSMFMKYAVKHRPDWIAFLVNKNSGLVRALIDERKFYEKEKSSKHT